MNAKLSLRHSGMSEEGIQELVLFSAGNSFSIECLGCTLSVAQIYEEVGL